MKKITFITYLSVIAITAICAMIFKERLNIVIDSLIPVGVMIIQFIGGLLIKCDIYYSHGGKVRLLGNIDFKYQKDERGDGKLEVVDSYRGAVSSRDRLAVGYSFIFGGALSIPFIFFFSVGAKWASTGLLVISSIIGGAAAIFLNFKAMHDDMKKISDKYEKQKKELEEQKKREELGKWK